MELLLWLQTIAFFAQVFDMARAQSGFSTRMLVMLQILNLSDSNNIFYLHFQLSFDLRILQRLQSVILLWFNSSLIEEKVHSSQENSDKNVQFKINCNPKVCSHYFVPYMH